MDTSPEYIRMCDCDEIKSMRINNVEQPGTLAIYEDMLFVEDGEYLKVFNINTKRELKSKRIKGRQRTGGLLFSFLPWDDPPIYRGPLICTLLSCPPSFARYNLNLYGSRYAYLHQHV